MAIYRLNPNAPIPNNPFYAPTESSISTSAGPLIAGSGIVIDYVAGTISATGGGGGGGVTRVTAGAGLSGGSITTTGTISMPNVGTAGPYTYPSQITTDVQGRVVSVTSGSTPVFSVGGTSPVNVTPGTTPVISICQASTTGLGVTQLFDGVTSQSSSLALTAKQGYLLQQQINTLNASSSLTFAGTFNPSTQQLVTVSSAGGSATPPFSVGANLPSPAAGITDFFVIATAAGTYTPPGGGSLSVTAGDWILCNGTIWELIDVGATTPYATTLVPGSVCLSTNSLAQGGTDTITALTPASAASAYVPRACYAALGTLVAGTSTPGSPTAIPAGTNGRILSADSTAAGGLRWICPPTGTVTCITTAGGICGGPITSTGTIALEPSGVTAGSYTNANITVDATGRVTAATCGASAGIPCACITGKGALVTGTGVCAPVALSPGTNGWVLTADSTCSSGLKWAPASGGSVTCINVGTGLSGGPAITTTGTIALANTSVVAGCYTNATICVDAQGRLTSAACGIAPITSLNVGTGLSGGPVITSTGTIALANTAVTAGCYTNATICVDAQGRLTSAACGTPPVTAVTGSAPICVTSGTTPNVCINPASTSGCGAVQLFDGVTSQSSALALTANQGYLLQQQINNLNAAGGLTLAGTFNATTSQLVTVTTSGAGASFAVGSNLPAAAPGNADFFVIVTTGGTYTPPGGTSTIASQGDWFLSSGTAWEFLNVGPSYPYATDTTAGIVCLSTNLAAQGGTDTTTALTPANAASAYISKSCVTGKGALITGTGACAPTALTAGSNGQYLVACSSAASGLCWLSPVAATTTNAGIVQLATNAETLAGTDATKAVTPSGLFFAVTCCFLPKSSITGKGAIITGTAASAPSALAVGTTGQVLTVDPACSSGLKWATPAGSSSATPLARGTMFGCTTAWDSGNLEADVALGNCAYVARTTGTGNTAIGGGALISLTDGSRNTALGNASGLGIVSGVGNTVIGSYAALANDFSESVVIGSGAVSGNVVVNDRNVVVGANALSVFGTASGISNSIIIGYGAGTNLADTSGCNIVLIGNGVCGSGGGSASDQLAIGCGFRYWLSGDCNFDIKPGFGILDCTNSAGSVGQALVSLGNVPGYGNRLRWCSLPGATAATTGFGGTAQGIMWGCTTTSNTALGYNSLGTGVTGSANVSVGLNAFSSATTANRNVILGAEAGRSMTAGVCNTAVGYLAGCNATTACFNVLVGNSAGVSITTGCCNVLVGTGAGSGVTTGLNNVAIGPNAAVASGSASCQLAIGFSATDNWLIGDSSKHIRPGAGIRDCTGSLGTAGQYLSTTGSAIQWGTPTTVGPGWTFIGAPQDIGWTATTTAPTLVSGTFGIWLRQVGVKIYQLQFYINKTVSGTSGSGDYLFTLPSGLSFNTGSASIPWQQVYTGSVNTGWGTNLRYIIPGTTGVITDGSNTGLFLSASVYSATQFRLVAQSGSQYQAWGGTFYGANTALTASTTFEFVST